MLSVIDKFERKQPISIYKNHLPYIDILFNISLKVHQNDQTNYSPFLKVGFFGNADHFLDRMFVVEDGPMIVVFVRNVQNESDVSSYKRSVYMIIRRKLKFIHFDSGIIFDDIFDYAHIENEEVNKYISFVYNGNVYKDIKEISNIDLDYKSKTKIYIDFNGMELQNDLYYYCYAFQGEISKKIGYYIPTENIEYYHVVHHFRSDFGKNPNQQLMFQNLLNDTNNFYTLINYIFEDPNFGKAPEFTRYGNIKKKASKSTYNGVSLVTQLATKTDIQSKKMIIGWFICEILYQFFFYN